MNNAVIYARYSSHSQTEQSIEGQLRDCHEWAERQGIPVIEEYIDRAQSGTKDQRRDFQRMIADATHKQFQTVIVWKLDRFARNRYDSAIYKARLKKYGVRVVSVKESITDSPEGIILEGLLESMAEYYSANLSQNIRRGQRESAAKGTWCGGRVPLGYKNVDRRLVIDPKSAEVVRFIFTQYAQGIPKQKIIADLNARGITGRNGKPFTQSTFQRVLTNPAYIGKAEYNGSVIPDLADRIIDDDTFNAAQSRLKQNARAPAANRGPVRYLLQGKAFCGKCGAPMIGESGRARSGEVMRYYACTDKKHKHTCTKRNEKKDFIEWYIVEQTMQYILSPSRVAHIASAVVEEYNKEFCDTRVTDMERAIAQLDRELDNLIDALAETPKALRSKITARMDTLSAQKADLETDLARLRIATGIRLSEKEVLAWLRQFCTGDPLDEEFRQRIIDVFINAVYLYDDRIIVFYNVKGGKQVSYMDLINAADLPPDAPSDVSTLKRNAPPNPNKVEPRYVFVNGTFGCIFYRE